MCLVVEHLLEVRHEPPGVHRVTRKPAAQLVVNAAGRHAVAGVQHHARGFIVLKTFRAAQQQRWQAGLRKFGSATKTPVARVIGGLEHPRCVTQGVRRQDQIARGCICSRDFEPGMDVGGGSGDFAASGLPGLVDLPEQLQKARTALAIVRREIGAAEKRLEFRCEKDIQRPAAGAGRGLHEGHVNLVHIGPLLAIHLDADEARVQKHRDLFVLERFALHDVAPVAGGVADAEKNRPVFDPRLFKRLIAPGEPIHGIVRVLEQVRRLFPRQAVGAFVGGGFHTTYDDNKRILSK